MEGKIILRVELDDEFFEYVVCDSQKEIEEVKGDYLEYAGSSYNSMYDFIHNKYGGDRYLSAVDTHELWHFCKGETCRLEEFGFYKYKKGGGEL